MPKDIDRPASADGRRRGHVSTACEICRMRKVKCDGVQPECGTCSVQRYECKWSTKPDRRREAAVKQHEMQQEINELKSELAEVKLKLDAHINSRQVTPEAPDGGVRQRDAKKDRRVSPNAGGGLLRVPDVVVSDDASTEDAAMSEDD